MSGLEQVGLMLLLLLFGYMLVTYIQKNPQALSKINLLKASNTMLLLATILIGFLAVVVIVLRN